MKKKRVNDLLIPDRAEERSRKIRKRAKKEEEEKKEDEKN